MQWNLINKTAILETIPFTVEKLGLEDRRSGQTYDYFRLLTCDWVNVVPVTKDHKVILVCQSRAGLMGETLEIPGGMIDQSDASPKFAAARELEEETGYRPRNMIHLGSINPNPAIMANEVHMFLATNVYIPAERQYFPDQTESLQVKLVPMASLCAMARQGKLNSALTALTILMAEPEMSKLTTN